ncbi:hypothetical protein ACOJIU_11995 [Carnobacterium maltaromaticum]|uniref:hypothetical protein n=1 Tax=Carnobacterium maltaromaticum TaxID=2751 RepID=UPI0012F8F33D|nr:hypothetical protein [Carnobacterium maltaromaticum]
MTEEKGYTLEEIMLDQFKLLHEAQKKEETTTKEKIEISLAMVRIYETVRYI